MIADFFNMLRDIYKKVIGQYEMRNPRDRYLVPENTNYSKGLEL